ncbi:hypothetical protein WA158_000348 [Blastocystis sp. Blastoise]
MQMLHSKHISIAMSLTKTYIRSFSRVSIEPITDERCDIQSIIHKITSNKSKSKKSLAIQIPENLESGKVLKFFDSFQSLTSPLSIDSFIFWGRKVDDKEIVHFSQLLQSQSIIKLRALNFGNTDFRPDYLNEILRSIYTGKHQLKVLELDGNPKLGENLINIDDSHLQNGGKYIEELNLDAISLSNNNIQNDINNDGIKSLFSTLEENSSLKLNTLGLSLNPVDADCVSFLVSRFRENALPSLSCLQVMFPNCSSQSLYELQYVFCQQKYPLDVEAAKQFTFYRIPTIL